MRVTWPASFEAVYVVSLGDVGSHRSEENPEEASYAPYKEILLDGLERESSTNRLRYLLSPTTILLTPSLSRILMPSLILKREQEWVILA